MAAPIPACSQEDPMIPTDEQATAAFANRALLPLMVVVTLALGWILLPFYGAIMWGAILALLFTPVYRHLLARLKWRRTSFSVSPKIPLSPVWDGLDFSFFRFSMICHLFLFPM